MVGGVSFGSWLFGQAKRIDRKQGNQTNVYSTLGFLPCHQGQVALLCTAQCPGMGNQHMG